MSEVGPTSAAAGGIPLRPDGKLVLSSFPNQIAAAVNNLTQGKSGPVGAVGRAMPVALVHILDNTGCGDSWYRGVIVPPGDNVLDPTVSLVGNNAIQTGEGNLNPCFIANWAELGVSDHPLVDVIGEASLYPAIMSGWAKSPSDANVLWPCYHIWAIAFEDCNTGGG